MIRLTKKVRLRLLELNDGFTVRKSYNSRNQNYDRIYKILAGKLYIQEDGKTSWSDSRYSKNWIASDEEVHRFLYDNLWKLNTNGLE